MPIDHNQGRRGHFHRGRRGPDRRGPERRGPDRPPGPPAEQVNRSERADRVDVEQIMREIRGRISQRSGIDLSNQQIQELAARRLEAILDPRGLKPELLDQLRRSAGERPVTAGPAATSAKPSYPFDEASLYDSPNGLLRLIRKLMRPFLRMLFNPTPIAHALAVQSRLNTELGAREAEHDRRQAEWNALHYEILQRLAIEISRASIEAQSLALRVESLAAKVDFNERRVRTMEGSQTRTPRPSETPQPVQQAAAAAATEGTPAPVQAPPEGQSGEAPRRRRRRRRGRRGPGLGTPPDATASAATPAAMDEGAALEEGESDADEGFEEEAPASEPAALAQPQPVPLDHRLPEPVAHHEEVASPSKPARTEDSPNAPEE